MSFIQYLILIFVAYVCIYSLLSRVCSCIEKCTKSKSKYKFTGTDDGDLSWIEQREDV
jgi:hypothetical protein